MRSRLNPLDLIWGFLLTAGIALMLIRGEPERATSVVIHASEGAIALVIGLVGAIGLWTGLMRVAEEAGLHALIARVLGPFLRRLFPELPAGHPALGTVALAIGSNLLGLGNASTPLGLKAMEELQKLNPDKNEPSDAECTFLCIIMGGLTLVPATVIALRAQLGSTDPTACLGPTLCATLAGTAATLSIDRLARVLRKHRKRGRDR